MPQEDSRGEHFAHVPLASRKDLRDAVTAARNAQSNWWDRSAFNRSQILFRIAEMLEDRSDLFAQRLKTLSDYSDETAKDEVAASIDRVFWYAGWCDKIDQVLGSVNRVASPFFNFTVAEPGGVAVVFVPRRSPLLGLVSALMPPLAAGNTVILIADHSAPVIPLDFAEVIATSDVPSGVVQILTGLRKDLLKPAAGHMDVNAIGLFEASEDERTTISVEAAENVKRVVLVEERDWQEKDAQSLYQIERWLEWKTTWHPVGT